MYEEADGSLNRPFVCLVSLGYRNLWYIGKTFITLGSLIFLICSKQ